MSGIKSYYTKQLKEKRAMLVRGENVAQVKKEIKYIKQLLEVLNSNTIY